MLHQISEFELARFARGMSSAVENRRIVAHLLSGCAACSARLASFVSRPAPPGAYDAVFSRLERGAAVAQAGGAPRRPVARRA